MQIYYKTINNYRFHEITVGSKFLFGKIDSSNATLLTNIIIKVKVSFCHWSYFDKRSIGGEAVYPTNLNEPITLIDMVNLSLVHI